MGKPTPEGVPVNPSCAACSGGALCAAAFERPPEIPTDIWRRNAVPAWVRFYAVDFFDDEDVDELAGEDQALYALLLLRQASGKSGSLPRDRGAIERRCQLRPGALDGAWAALEPLFPVWCDGRRRNPRMAFERHRAVASVSRMSAGGRVGRATQVGDELEGPPGPPPQGPPRGPLSPSLSSSSPNRSGSPNGSRPSSSVSPDSSLPEDPRAREDSGELAELVDLLEASLRPMQPTYLPAAGTAEHARWRESQAREARLLRDAGGLQDPRDKAAPPCQPQPVAAIRALLAWLGQQPPASSGDDFSWRSNCMSFATLRRKWPKIAKSAREQLQRAPDGDRRRALGEIAWAELRALLRQGGYDSSADDHLRDAVANRVIGALGGLRLLARDVERDEAEAHRRFLRVYVEGARAAASGPALSDDAARLLIGETP